MLHVSGASDTVVLQDYNDHIAEISAKLVAIMDSLFEKVLSKVRSGSVFLTTAKNYPTVFLL